jgi:hypothetical protein
VASGGINRRRSERPRRGGSRRQAGGDGVGARTREARGAAGKPGREEDDDARERERERGCGMEIWISLSLAHTVSHNTTTTPVVLPGFRCVSSFWIWIGLSRFDSGVN